MGDEHAKIELSDHALGSEMGRSFSDMEVIDDISGQEQNGRNQSRDHTRDMLPPISTPDQKPAASNENGTNEIE